MTQGANAEKMREDGWLTCRGDEKDVGGKLEIFNGGAVLLLVMCRFIKLKEKRVKAAIQILLDSWSLVSFSAHHFLTADRPFYA